MILSSVILMAALALTNLRKMVRTLAATKPCPVSAVARSAHMAAAVTAPPSMPGSYGSAGTAVFPLGLPSALTSPGAAVSCRRPRSRPGRAVRLVRGEAKQRTAQTVRIENPKQSREGAVARVCRVRVS